MVYSEPGPEKSKDLRNSAWFGILEFQKISESKWRAQILSHGVHIRNYNLVHSVLNVIFKYPITLEAESNKMD